MTELSPFSDFSILHSVNQPCDQSIWRTAWARIMVAVSGIQFWYMSWLPFCCICFSMGDLGMQISIHLSVRFSVRPSINIYPGCLVSATPLTVLYQSFWNLAGVFIMVWGCACGLNIIVRLFFVTLSSLWISHFSISIYRQLVPCEHNSSYNFISIFLKLCTWFLHGL